MEMEKEILVMEISCYPYDNGISHHEVHLFKRFSEAMDFINKECASDYGQPIPENLKGHVGYGYKEIDGVEMRPQWHINGHWRAGGVIMYPVLTKEKVRKGAVKEVEIYPMEIK